MTHGAKKPLIVQVTVIGDVVGSLLAYDILCAKDEDEHDLMLVFN